MSQVFFQVFFRFPSGSQLTPTALVSARLNHQRASQVGTSFRARQPRFPAGLVFFQGEATQDIEEKLVIIEKYRLTRGRFYLVHQLLNSHDLDALDQEGKALSVTTSHIL
jgi:hypothetical protein